MREQRYRQLRNPHVTPPTYLGLEGSSPKPGFWDRDPDTGSLFYKPTLSELVSALIEHRFANNLPCTGSIALEVEDRICARLDSSFWRWRRRADARRFFTGPIRPDVSVEQIKKTVAMFGRWLRSGRPIVEEEEATRRASICANCPGHFNVRIMGCTGCKAGYALVRKLRPRKHRMDSKLKVCAVCKCENRTQIWLPSDFLGDTVLPNTLSQFPVGCWKKELVGNAQD